MNLKLSIVNYQLSIFVAIVTFFALPLKAQVTIGAQKAPHSYSVLELMSTKGGLRLPMLSNDERDALKLTSDSTEANGLVIYNTDIDCMEFWSNGKWIDLCSNALPSANINPATLAALSAGSGSLSGRTCFDIGEGNFGTVYRDSTGHTPNRSDFAQDSVHTQYYIFTPPATGTVKNVRYLVEDPKGTLAGTQGTRSLSGWLIVGDMANSASIPLELDFKNDLNSHSGPIYGLTRENAAPVTINIIYNDGTTDVKAPPLTTKIQDCFCCGAQLKDENDKYYGREFMCYNLGAAANVQTISPDRQAAYTTPVDNYGNYYQWGRTADGHQLRNSTPIPGPVTTFDANGQATGDTISKFITNGNIPYDWRVPQDNNLWSDSGKTGNDPCPEGWRVPTHAEWISIFDGNLSTTTSIPAAGYMSASGNTWKWNSTGTTGFLVTPSGSSEATLFLPAGGDRYYSNGGGDTVASNGYYWSSSIYTVSNNAYDFTFYSTTMNPNNSNFRAYGFSVRCITE